MRLWILGLSFCLLLLVVFHYKVHFEWLDFWREIHQVRAINIAVAAGLIYLSVTVRAFRWTALLRPQKRVASSGLVGPQFIGFTCVALFGSLGDLVRPYLISRHVRLPLASQIATYTIERMFDIGSAAILFSIALVTTSKAADPLHRATFLRIGVISSFAVLLILAGATAVRRYGADVAHWIEALEQIPSTLRLGMGNRLRSFREGLRTVETGTDFLVVLTLSLVIWSLVAAAYVEVAHAFVHTSQLVGVTFSQTMLLVAASIGGSLVQLPVIGWFTQITATAATMHALLGVPTEVATVCGALLLCVTFLFLIPGGLFFAHSARISLRVLIAQSEDVESIPAKTDRESAS